MTESITIKITMKKGFTVLPGFAEVIKRNKGIESVEVLEQIKDTQH